MPSKNVAIHKDCLNDYSNAAHVGNVTNNNSSERERNEGIVHTSDKQKNTHTHIEKERDK